MKNPFKKKMDERDYHAEQIRLLEKLAEIDPASDDYDKVMNQLDQLDKIMNRSSEMSKSIIPAVGTVAGVAGVYAIQQFGGILVPKALDAIASRGPQKPHNS